MNRNELDAAILAAAEPVELTVGPITRSMVDVSAIPGVDELPLAHLILLENVLRRERGSETLLPHAHAILDAASDGASEIEYLPSRVLFQDFTGVPVFVDFAAMRDWVAENGGDPALVNPRIPCDLVIDHSVIADVAGCEGAAAQNEAIEAERNRERFAFLKWAGASFDRVSITPPGVGICHQLNLERLSRVVGCDALWEGPGELACFDTVVGTDSHTTTANGIGVLSWGVGGIEAEAAALGQPISMLVPPVTELRLEGVLPEGASGMDLALAVCELLRAEGVVGQFVEVTGEGAASLTPTQRSCVANMTPEYGATATLFAADSRTLDYLALTGRDPAEIDFAKAYLCVQGVFERERQARYDRKLVLDLASIRPSLAGPSRPHRRVEVAALKERFEEEARAHGRDLSEKRSVSTPLGEREVGNGAVAIAAITSCTTATDPAMMVAAGLAAKKARQRGLVSAPWVKTILAPGSHAVTGLLDAAGLSKPLAELGFFTCGYGCMSCIGNSGPILEGLSGLASELDLASVLSGNRNFDGRISPDVAQNFLASPALVVAYAIAGTVDADLSCEPVGFTPDGEPVFLADILPASDEIDSVLSEALTPELYAGTGAASAAWDALPAVASDTYAWEDSGYIRKAPYLDIARPEEELSIEDARLLAYLGDFVTTDHISPAGSIASDSPAARYLMARGVAAADFNTYGARRGNHEVMMRGTFANIRLENYLADGRLGGWTKGPDGTAMPIYDAAMAYAGQGEPLVVVAGDMYGSGSSRDWAAKGPYLLGVRAVIAKGFERIHRSNLVQMGVVPLEIVEGDPAELCLKGDERFDVGPISLAGGLPEPALVTVGVSREGERLGELVCRVRIDTPAEAAFVASGGILPYVARQLLG